MDMICFRCGEPWGLDTVLHESKEKFTREGCVIRRCPSCSSQTNVELPEEQRRILNELHAAAVMFGDDYDGFVCFLEDIHAV